MDNLLESLGPDGGPIPRGPDGLTLPSARSESRPAELGPSYDRLQPPGHTLVAVHNRVRAGMDNTGRLSSYTGISIT